MDLLDSIKRKLSQTVGGAVQAVKNLFSPIPKQTYTPPSFTYASPKVTQNAIPLPKAPSYNLPKVPSINLSSQSPSSGQLKFQPSLPKITLPPIIRQTVSNVNNLGSKALSFGSSLIKGGSSALPLPKPIDVAGWIGRNLMGKTPEQITSFKEAELAKIKPPTTVEEKAGDIAGNILSNIGQFYLAGKLGRALLE